VCGYLRRYLGFVGGGRQWARRLVQRLLWPLGLAMLAATVVWAVLEFSRPGQRNVLDFCAFVGVPLGVAGAVLGAIPPLLDRLQREEPDVARLAAKLDAKVRRREGAELARLTGNDAKRIDIAYRFERAPGA
jgi:hypothetical protein